MTLVVARRSEDRLVVASDLRVTDAHDIRRGYPFGILKAVTLSPDLCVAFAGPVEAAVDAVREVAQVPASLDDVTPFLARASTSGPDFLVVSSVPPRIVRVRAGVVEADLAAAWIGDQDAFSAFQALALDESQVAHMPAEYRLQAAVVTAFMQLVGGDVKSVGEAAVIVSTLADRHLHYQPGAVAFAAPQTIPSGEWTTIRFGSAAEGGHAYSVLTPTAPGPGALGLHFHQGQLGLLYHPLHDRLPVAYPNMSHDEFRAAVLADFGLDIQGLVIS